MADTDDDQNPIDTPVADVLLDIGRAVVRPYVTSLFATALVVFTYLGMIDGTVFVAVASGSIAYWFGSREHKPPAA